MWRIKVIVVGRLGGNSKMSINHAMIANKNQWCIMEGTVGVTATNVDVKFKILLSYHIPVKLT